MTFGKVFGMGTLIALGLSSITSNMATNLGYDSIYEIAQKHVSGKSGDSYYAAASLVKSLGGDSNGYNWKSNKNFQGKTLKAGISRALESKVLSRGMVLYINNAPGKDPSSTMAEYAPHWLVYLGKDSTGTDRFADQHFAGYALDGDNSLLSRLEKDHLNKVRLVDEILDPFERAKVPTGDQTTLYTSSEDHGYEDSQPEEALERALDKGFTPGFDDIMESGPTTEEKRSGSTGLQTSAVVPDKPENTREATRKDRNFVHSFRKVQGIAWNQASGVKGDNYRAILKTAKNLGAKGNGWSWSSNKKYRKQPILQGLSAAIRQGDLLPGMVVYLNNQPGTDPSSQKMEYQPHWFTYLGKDLDGEDRFADQYNADWKIDGLNAQYARDASGKTRMVDEILDPYAIH